MSTGISLPPQRMYRSLKGVADKELLRRWQACVGDDLYNVIPRCSERILKNPTSQWFPDLSWVVAAEEEMVAGFISCITEHTCCVCCSVPPVYPITCLQSLSECNPYEEGIFRCVLCEPYPLTSLTDCLSRSQLQPCFLCRENTCILPISLFPKRDIFLLTVFKSSKLVSMSLSS